MKIDILTHGDPSQFNTKDGAYLGGGVGFVTHLLSALSECDVNVVIDGGTIRKDADVYFLSSFGVNEERNDKGKRNSDLKYKQLNEVGGKKFVLIHGVAEFRFYKHSLEHLKQLTIDKVILTGNSETMKLAVRQNLDLPDSKITVIPMPFKFDPSQFADRSKMINIIISPARIAAAKNTMKILDIAQQLKKKTFLMCGLQKGMYWHYSIEPNPQSALKNLKWLGARSDVFEPYRKAAFSIDLTAFWFGKLLEGKRTQYTTLEAVNCGCIPITWEHWDNGSWRGIFLPSPQKNGNRIVWDITECIERIKGFPYDVEMARYNLESLMKSQSIDVIGKRYMKEFAC